jgi:hypothetical protein
MTLTPEQKEAVAAWAAAGDNLSTIQGKLTAQFKVSIKYMDLRFLLDDLNVQLKDAAPKKDTVLKSPAPSAAEASEGAAPGGPFAAEDGDLPPDVPDKAVPAGAASVSVSVDKITLIPGALASGGMTFANGVTGKWIVDNQGRPGITEVSRPDFRPSQAEAQAFMQELSRVLQQRGF